MRDFLHASYALLAEEHQRIDPLKHLEKVSEQVAERTQPVVKPDTAQQNTESMAMLQSMLSGVKKAPRKTR